MCLFLYKNDKIGITCKILEYFAIIVLKYEEFFSFTPESILVLSVSSSDRVSGRRNFFCRFRVDYKQNFRVPMQDSTLTFDNSSSSKHFQLQSCQSFQHHVLLSEVFSMFSWFSWSMLWSFFNGGFRTKFSDSTTQ